MLSSGSDGQMELKKSPMERLADSITSSGMKIGEVGQSEYTRLSFAPMSNFRSFDELMVQMADIPKTCMKDKQASLFDSLAGGQSNSLILFGAGPLGKQALAGLRSVGNEPKFFIDNRESLWGQKVDGIQVLAPSEAATLYGRSLCFVVTIYNSSRPIKQLRDLGCVSVVGFPALYWKYEQEFIPWSCMGLAHPMWDARDDIRRAYQTLADEESRLVFLEQLQWRMDLDSSKLSPPSPVAETYFPADIFATNDQEVFVDCGAFDGDSIGSFLAQHNQNFAHIYALEPDAQNREKLERFREQLPAAMALRLTILPYAVGEKRAFVKFLSGDNVRSHVSAETGNAETECVPLDELFAGDGLTGLPPTYNKPTYIKMDIEGAEPEAIKGAANLLSTAKPVLAACVYHRWEHLWEVPLLIDSLTRDHKIFLRRYAEDCWELVCYAVPQSRLS